MKKLISLFLCILMVMSVVTPAFAATTDLTGDEGLTTPVKNIASVNDFKVDGVNTMIADTPTKYLFKPASGDTKSYILLKNVNAGENDGYFVMVQDGGPSADSGTSAVNSLRNAYPGTSSAGTTEAPTVIFDKENVKSIGYYLNQESYITEQFPVMKDYINNHIWYTEGTKDDVVKPYSTAAKIALPSVSEYKENIDRIGVNSITSGRTEPWSTMHFIMRTAHPGNGDQIHTKNTYTTKAIWLAKNNNGTLTMQIGAAVYYWQTAERPCFYLNEDFFKNVKLDMTLLKTEESEAAKIIKNIASTEEGLNALKTNAGYTSEELIELGIAAGGVQITSATLEGTGKCGDTLVATAVNNKTATKTEYEWIKVNADNTQEALNSTTNNYTVKFADLGASIKCFVKVYDGEELSHTAYTNSVSTETKPTFPTSYSSYKLSGTVATDGIAKTPDAYKFSVDGKELTLLQSVNAGENDGQFVTLTTPVNPGTTIPYYKAATVDEFKALDFTYDPTNPKSIAYGINQDSFLNQYIPNSAKAYLNTHRWWNEGISNTTGGYTKDAFATESKVAIMSYTEYLANYDRVGYKESSLGLVLRTPRYDNGGSIAFTKGNPCLVLVTNKDYNSASSSAQYRFSQLTFSSTANDEQILNYGWYQDKPICFYLNPEFFANVKVDFTAENTEVIAILREKLAEKSVDELIGMGYSYKEIKTLFPSTEVDSIEMYGFAKSGDNSKITYKCENTTDGEITFRPVVAVYGTDGTLLQSYIASSDLTLAAGEVALAPLDIAADISNAATLKTFAWSSLDSIVPLSDCTTVNYSTLASEP
ncbi:MAG: hypothetical protein MRZ29_09230 [Oscillospiraceae bacterium]|nr:hypothetical protein [Oscillospiraceae bacterium]